MVDIKNIKFKKESTDNPHVTRNSAELKITAEVSVDNRIPAPDWMIEDNLKKAAWHHIYGDLMSPLEELKDHALRYCPSHDRHDEVLKICQKLNEMLTRP